MVGEDKDGILALGAHLRALHNRSEARRKLELACRHVDETGRMLSAASIIALHAYNLVLVPDLQNAVEAVRKKYDYDPSVRIFGNDIVVLIHDRAHLVELSRLRAELGMNSSSLPEPRSFDDDEEVWNDNEEDAIVRFGYESQFGRETPRPNASEVFAKIDQLRNHPAVEQLCRARLDGKADSE